MPNLVWGPVEVDPALGQAALREPGQVEDEAQPAQTVREEHPNDFLNKIVMSESAPGFQKAISCVTC